MATSLAQSLSALPTVYPEAALISAIATYDAEPKGGTEKDEWLLQKQRSSHNCVT